MTDQNQETATNEVAEQQTSREDKFFGVKTSIEDMVASEHEGDPKKAAEAAFEIVDGEESGEEKAAAEEANSGKVAPISDDDLAQTSEKVQKRIAKLTWEKKEAQRKYDAIEAENKEAVAAARSLLEQNQNLHHTIVNGEAFLIQQMKERAAAALQNAQTNYKAAYDAGESSDKVVEAQQAMMAANADAYAANQAEQEYNNRVARNQQHQQQVQLQQQQQRQAPKPTVKRSEEGDQWVKDNPWFHDGDHPQMTALAYGTHEDLVKRQGVEVNSPEYYEKLDAEMRVRFPEYFTEAGENNTQQRTAPSTVVASGERNNGAKQRKVKLSPEARRLCKKFGITEQQYAHQVLQLSRTQ